MAKETKSDINFRRLKKGKLVKIIEQSQPVVFEEVKRFNNPRIDDLAVVVYLDPIDGLTRGELPLNGNGTLRRNGCHSGIYINVRSREGRKYLKLITEYNQQNDKK